jgi:hypothetical protein
MADPKTRKKRLALGIETSYSTSTFPTIREWPFDELGDLTDGKAPLETARHTGRTGMTASVPGPDSGSTSGKLEVVGFAGGVVDDGDSVPADDYLDDFFGGFAADGADADGEGAAVTGTALTLDSDVGLAAGDVIPLQDSLTGATEFVPVASGSGASLTLAWAPSIAAAVDLAPGSKRWRDDEGNDTTNSYAGTFEQDGDQFDLHGVKLTGVTLATAPDARAMFEGQLAVDRMDVPGSETPPSFTGVPSATPQRVACLYVDGALVDVASIEIDFGVDAQPRASTKQDSGRSEHLHMAVNPTITVVPVYTHDHRNLKRNQDKISVLVQVGNNWCFWAPVCQVSEAAPTDASGLQRQTLTIMVKDPESGTTPKWQMVRA